MENTPRRNTGIDLLRMVSMYLVVLLHVQGHGGVLGSTNLFSAHNLVAVSYQAVAYCSVNCFGLISGYVMVKSGVKLKKLILMWMQVAFYSFGITAFAALIGHIDPDRAMWLESMFPVYGKAYWYVTAYFGMMLLAPAAAYAVEHMPQKTLRGMLIAAALLISVAGTLTRQDPFAYELGYSSAWLMFLFMLGGYLRRYGAFTGWSAKKLFAGFLAFSAGTVVFKLISYLPQYFYCPVLENANMLEFISPTVLGASIMLFLCFERLAWDGKLAQRLVGLSPFAFGVYLVHGHSVIYRQLGWRFHSYLELPVWGLAVAVPLTAAAIYLICTLIDWGRSLLFRLFRLEKAADWIANRIEKATESFAKICR